MKKLFEIGIGKDRNGKYVAVIQSLTDNKHRAVDGDSMRILMAKVTKLVRKKNLEFTNFPLPRDRPVRNNLRDILVEASKN